METGTIVYKKKRKVNFIGVVLNLSWKDPIVYFYDKGKLKRLSYKKFSSKYKNHYIENPKTPLTTEQRIKFSSALTSLWIKKKKYTFLEKVFVFLNHYFNIEWKMPKKIVNRNNFLYKADFIQYVFKATFPYTYNYSTGVKINDFLNAYRKTK